MSSIFYQILKMIKPFQPIFTFYLSQCRTSFITCATTLTLLFFFSHFHALFLCAKPTRRRITWVNRSYWSSTEGIGVSCATHINTTSNTHSPKALPRVPAFQPAIRACVKVYTTEKVKKTRAKARSAGCVSKRSLPGLETVRSLSDSEELGRV